MARRVAHLTVNEITPVRRLAPREDKKLNGEVPQLPNMMAFLLTLSIIVAGLFIVLLCPRTEASVISRRGSRNILEPSTRCPSFEGRATNLEQSPLLEAITRGRGDKVKKLLSHKISPTMVNVDGKGAIHLAVESGSLASLRFLIKAGAAIDSHDNLGNTPLHLACEGGNREILQTLIDNGANIEARTIEGRTPLHIAAASSRYDNCQALLATGASVNSQDNEGQTPLHLAARKGKRRLSKLLLASGAIALCCDDSGLTARDYARLNGYPRLAHELSCL